MILYNILFYGFVIMLFYAFIIIVSLTLNTWNILWAWVD